MSTRPEDYERILGKNFATRNRSTILSIGPNGPHFNRYDLGEMGCPHTVAARTLDSAIKKLHVASIEDLVKHHSPEDFVEIHGFGVTSFYALTCILKHFRVPLKKFYTAKVQVTAMTQAVRKREHKGRKGAAA